MKAEGGTQIAFDACIFNSTIKNWAEREMIHVCLCLSAVFDFLVSSRSDFCCRETDGRQVAKAVLACWDATEEQDADRVQLGIVLGCKWASSPASFSSAPCKAVVPAACSSGVGGQMPSLALPSGRDLSWGVNPLLFTLPCTKGEFSHFLRHRIKAIYTVWYSFKLLPI